MNCPECGEKMSGEALPVTGGLEIVGINMVTKEFDMKHVKTPSGHYYCESCDSEWIWLQRKSNFRKIDGADRSPVEVLEET